MAEMPTSSSPTVVRVECYAGYRGEQEPRRFHAGGRVIEVIEIVDRWQGPDHRYFKVEGSDDGAHLLRHDEVSGVWERIPQWDDQSGGGSQ